MEGYLGETLVDITKHPEYSKYTQSDWAMLYVEMYGGIDGDHHKTWVLDQVSRILKGSPVHVKTAKWDNGHEEDRYTVGEPSQTYLDWVEEMKEYNEETGEYECFYDEGVAP